MRIKGWLDSLVLAVVQQQPSHGYRIAATLRAAGIGDLADASLYPVLKRLETAGHVSSDWDMSGSGPARKVYFPTVEGSAALTADIGEWETLRSGIDKLFTAAMQVDVK